MQTAVALATLSGLLILAVGVALLASRPRRSGSRFFGVFAMLWGADVAVANLSRAVTDPELALRLLHADVALRIPQALFLLHFAVTFPRSSDARRATGTMAAAAVALAAAALFVVDPGSFLEGVAPAADRTWIPRWGLAQVLLVFLPFFLSFYAATWLLLRRYLEARDRLERREAAIVLTALACYVGYITPFQLLFFLFGWPGFAGTMGAVSSLLFTALFAGGALFLGAVAWRLSLRIRAGTAPDRRQSDLLVLAALVVPAAAGFAGAAPLAWGGRPFELLGAFRIAAAALIAYGVLKHHLFGLDLGLKRAVRGALPVAVFAGAALVAGAAAHGLAGPTELAGVPLAVVAGFAAGGTAAAFSGPLGRRVAERAFPFVGDDAEYRRARAVDVYRAALAQTVAQGLDDDSFLRALRRDLGIDARDHDLLLLVERARSDRAGAAGPPETPLAGRYERGRLLGEGGFARVWLARDRVLDRPVVLKELVRAGDPAALLEARAAGRVGSPNVVTVHDVLQDGGQSILVLEYVEGGSLQERLDRAGRLPRGEAVAVAADVLRGLAALHRAGLVHRDVKPANILLTADGRAKVSDLGIAAAAEAPRGGTVALGAGAGTPHYMSPEQAGGEPVDARTDLYAVGAVLYRMLAGRFHLDFGDDSDYRVRRRIRHEDPRLPLRGEPERLDALLARALARDPAQRFRSAEEMLAALVGSHEAVAASPPRA